MGNRRTPAERIDELNAKIDQLRARRQDLLAQARQRERKTDTRRKIILGGTILAMMRSDDAALYQAARSVYLHALSIASARDEALLRAAMIGDSDANE